MRALAVLGLMSWCLCLVAPSASAQTVLAPGEALTREMVADMVRDGLARQGMAGNVTIDVQEPRLSLPNRATVPVRIEIADLRFEPRTGRYEARFRATLSSGETAMVTSSGQVQELVEVVVPTRPIGRGETILPEDVAWGNVTEAALRADMLRRQEDLVGLQAARPLAPGRAVRGGDVVAPWLVRRGESAVMVFTRGALEILGVGIALDHGRAGDPIRVQNTAGGEVRHATVIGPQRVRIGSQGLLP